MTSITQLRVFLRGAGLAIGAYGIGQIVVLAGAVGLVFFGVPAFENAVIQIGLSTVLLQGVTFGGVALGYLYYSDRSFDFLDVRIPTRRDAIVAVVGTLALFVALVGLTQLFAQFGIQTAQSQIIEMGTETPEVFLLLVPLSYVLVGPGEELLYRGIIQRTLDEEFSTGRAIALASALFAVIHVFSLQGPGKLAYLAIVFVLACILGVCYRYTRNIVVPAFIHGTYNAVQFGIAYLSVTGALSV